MAEIEIEAFRAGTPASKGITAAQAKEAADGFNPDLHRAPIVMGHPNDDQSAPAFGEISGARADGNSLFVKVKNLAQEAVDGVRQSRILNRSIAFWHPNHPSNPNPGKLSLRHLGLLGGAAPAIPNLPALRFSADEPDQLVVDGEPGEAVIFAAPAEAQPIDVQALALQVAAIITPANEPNPNGKEFSVPTPEEMAAKEAELAEREAAIAAKETQFAADEKARAEKAKQDREAENVAFAAKLVAEGKFPAGHKDDLATILNAMPNEVLQFSGETSESPAAALRRILEQAAPVISFSTITPPGSPTFSADPNADAKEQAALAEANAKLETSWKK